MLLIFWFVMGDWFNFWLIILICVVILYSKHGSLRQLVNGIIISHNRQFITNKQKYARHFDENDWLHPRKNFRNTNQCQNILRNFSSENQRDPIIKSLTVISCFNNLCTPSFVIFWKFVYDNNGGDSCHAKAYYEDGAPEYLVYTWISCLYGKNVNQIEYGQSQNDDQTENFIANHDYYSFRKWNIITAKLQWFSPWINRIWKLSNSSFWLLFFKMFVFWFFLFKRFFSCWYFCF